MEATKILRLNDGNSPKYSSFPPEIITEILLRLPAKSIGRSRCVSKLFRSLSSELGFIKRYTGINSGSKKLLVSSCNLYTVGLDSVGEGTLVAVELDYPLKDEPEFSFDINSDTNKRRRLLPFGEMVFLKWGIPTRSYIKIIGSSNGLVCIYPQGSGSAAFLYNPITRESKQVPNTSSYEPYGFGFDTKTDDYKLVKFVDTGDFTGYHNADVYSLKKDSWRQIHGLNYEQFGGVFTGVELNGAIHWVVQLEKGVAVAAFDLTTDCFRDMQLPDEVGDSRYLQAANLMGRLCLVYCDRCNFIWVMNEYGVESSWSKVELGMLYASMAPICFSTKNDEEVLLKLDDKLVLYNFESKSIRNLNISCDIDNGPLGAITYVESLVSPNSYGNIGNYI